MTVPQGNINHSMRANYSQFGVDEYYKKVGASYRNPFFPGIRKVIFTLMDKWWAEEKDNLGTSISSSGNTSSPRELCILDLAAGSGEATICLQEWHATRTGKLVPNTHSSLATSGKPGTSQLMNPALARGPQLPNPLAALQGSSGAFSRQDRPAFIPPSRRPVVNADGEGSPDKRSDSSIPELRITATDPFTVSAYESRTAGTCLPLSFDDIVQGKLPLPTHNSSRKYDLVICSFALHLVGDHSEMFSLLYGLSQRAKWMMVLAPHKKPEIKDGWGWIRWDISTWQDGTSKLYSGSDLDEEETDEQARGSTNDIYRNGGIEVVIDRVRCRLYRSADREEESGV